MLLGGCFARFIGFAICLFSASDDITLIDDKGLCRGCIESLVDEIEEDAGLLDLTMELTRLIIEDEELELFDALKLFAFWLK